MTMRRAVLAPVIIGGVASAMVIIVFLIFLQLDIESKTTQLEKSKINLARTLASRAELRLSNAATLLEVTAQIPSVRDNSFSNLISEESRGIPQEADPEKRAVQRSMLSDHTFETVSFLMPNGDLYSLEPYSIQENLRTTNFAYREYYGNVMRLQSTYLGQVILSTATNHNTAVMATPVYKDGLQTGIWVGAMDLNIISTQLRSLDLGPNEVALIIDQSGKAIASSDKTEDTQSNARSYSYFDSVSRVIAGETGAGLQSINGTQIHVTYSPIAVPGNIWAVLLIQPSADAYSDIYAIQRQAAIIIAIVVCIMGISGYFLFRSNIRTLRLSDRLELVNEELKKVNHDLKHEKLSLEIQSKELHAKNDHLNYLSAELGASAEKLREMDKSKEEFSSMITHELKTPLVPIIGYGNLLLGGRLGDLTKTQKEKVSIMYENAQRLSKLIQDVLDAQKIELGRLRIDPQEIFADELIERSINAFTVAAEAKAIKLENKLRVQYDDGQNEVLRVKCDPDRIHQVLCNLISNAIKFVPSDDGMIEVSAIHSKGERMVIFSVKDNGIGIPPEKQKNLFTKFYQVDTSLTRNVGGTGLGLTIAKGIVEAHGGKMWVESEQAKGSIFHFSIPMEDKK